MIPRVFHQIYFPGWDALPEEAKARVAELKARNPGWEFRFYDAGAARDWLLSACGAEALATFEMIEPAYYAARADYLRYQLCHKVGGVYMDIKSGATSALDEVLRDDDVFILSQWPERRHLPAGAGIHPELANVQGDEFVQWFIVSAPDHPFLEAVIGDVTRNIRNYRPFRDGVGMKGVLRTTGPIAYTLAIDRSRGRYPHRMVEYETDLGFAYTTHRESHRVMYTKHYWAYSLPVVRTSGVEARLAEVWYGRIRPLLKAPVEFARRLAAR